jgi:hypothetical protein
VKRKGQNQNQNLACWKDSKLRSFGYPRPLRKHSGQVGWLQDDKTCLCSFIILLNEMVRAFQVAIDEGVGGAIGKSENGCGRI